MATLYKQIVKAQEDEDSDDPKEKKPLENKQNRQRVLALSSRGVNF
ncbi:19185_t:CDS:1, partial [Racocetra fulgida]